jgi:hypothetical protein
MVANSCRAPISRFHGTHFARSNGQPNIKKAQFLKVILSQRNLMQLQQVAPQACSSSPLHDWRNDALDEVQGRRRARDTVRFNFCNYWHQTICGIASAGDVFISPKRAAETFEEQFTSAIYKSSCKCRSRVLNAEFVNNTNIWDNHRKHSNGPAHVSRQKCSWCWGMPHSLRGSIRPLGCRIMHSRKCLIEEGLKHQCNWVHKNNSARRSWSRS